MPCFALPMLSALRFIHRSSHSFISNVHIIILLFYCVEQTQREYDDVAIIYLNAIENKILKHDNNGNHKLLTALRMEPFELMKCLVCQLNKKFENIIIVIIVGLRTYSILNLELYCMSLPYVEQNPPSYMWPTI